MYAGGKVKEIRKPTSARLANKMDQVFDNKLGLSVGEQRKEKNIKTWRESLLVERLSVRIIYFWIWKKRLFVEEIRVSARKTFR